MKHYNISDTESIPIIKIWLGWDGLIFIQTLIQIEQESCKRVAGLFKVLNNKCRQREQQNNTFTPKLLAKQAK